MRTSPGLWGASSGFAASFLASLLGLLLGGVGKLAGTSTAAADFRNVGVGWDLLILLMLQMLTPLFVAALTARASQSGSAVAAGAVGVTIGALSYVYFLTPEVLTLAIPERTLLAMRPRINWFDFLPFGIRIAIAVAVAGLVAGGVGSAFGIRRNATA